MLSTFTLIQPTNTIWLFCKKKSAIFRPHVSKLNFGWLRNCKLVKIVGFLLCQNALTAPQYNLIDASVWQNLLSEFSLCVSGCCRKSVTKLWNVSVSFALYDLCWTPWNAIWNFVINLQCVNNVKLVKKVVKKDWVWKSWLWIE